MRKYLFHQKKYTTWSKVLKFTFIGMIVIGILWKSLGHVSTQIVGNSSLLLQRTAEQLPIIGSSMHNKKIIHALTVENTLLRATLTSTSPQAVWTNKKILLQHIHRILWQHNEHWFVTTPCDGCVVFNNKGLIGRMDANHGHGIIKLITHHDTLLVARSEMDGHIYLLQGQGYQRNMLILESDISDYPPSHGDVLVTSGLDGLYPPHIPIGIVYKKSGHYVVHTFFNKKISQDIYVIPFNI